MILKPVIHEAEEGGFWAEVPALPGCFTQGQTLKELEANLNEAIEGWLLAAEPEGQETEGLELPNIDQRLNQMKPQIEKAVEIGGLRECEGAVTPFRLLRASF